MHDEATTPLTVGELREDLELGAQDMDALAQLAGVIARAGRRRQRRTGWGGAVAQLVADSARRIEDEAKRQAQLERAGARELEAWEDDADADVALPTPRGWREHCERQLEARGFEAVARW